VLAVTYLVLGCWVVVVVEIFCVSLLMLGAGVERFVVAMLWVQVAGGWLRLSLSWAAVGDVVAGFRDGTFACGGFEMLKFRVLC